MENKKELLEKLVKRNEELKPIVFKSFDTMEDLRNYKIEKKNIFNEYFDNQEKIKQLEYELKTLEEKKEYDEYLRKLKLKAEGKSLI